MFHPKKHHAPLRFRPLHEADPETWRRLIAANPIPSETVTELSLIHI